MRVTAAAYCARVGSSEWARVPAIPGNRNIAIEEQVPGHLDRTRLTKRGVRRTVFEFDFAIERAETSGQYGKPAEHWQKLRDAIRTGTARQVEKPTRRGMSVAWEMDVDMSLYRVPNPDDADVVNTGARVKITQK
jgi:hypothetical protein